jgi:hypothetical protein
MGRLILDYATDRPDADRLAWGILAAVAAVVIVCLTYAFLT